MRRLRDLLEITLLAILLLGCATPEDYTPPPKVALQEPLPGRGLVYLMRSPNDGLNLDLLLNEKKLTALPSSTYTVLSLMPGQYVLTTLGPRESTNGTPAIPRFTFELVSGQRLFLHLPAPERRYITGLSLISMAKGQALPLVSRQEQETGAIRVWTVTEEQDVHWFLHFAKLHLE